MKKIVTIIYKFLPQWRVDFFNKLNDSLFKNDIELNLVYGKLKGENSSKNDEVELSWAKFVPNIVFNLGVTELYWQPVFKHIGNSNLIIAEQANKLLINYLLMINKKFNNKKFALWGHGVNLQDNPDSYANKFKKMYSMQCDWWFAYTKKVKNTIEKIGFPAERITIVQNAIDTKILAEMYDHTDEKELIQLKKDNGIGAGPVGLYCGGMYKEKRLDFLLEACIQIKKAVPSFEMIFIGAGPEDFKIKKASSELKWIHYMGPKFNKEKVPFFKISDIFLMPGLVGLAVLDTFAMQTPIITTRYPHHSPEIEYLEDGFNGIIIDNNLDSFIDEVINILNDKTKLKILKEGCRKSSAKYTVENMVNNFSDGIKKCLAV